MMSRQHGLTLIEILVGIAVLAILAVMAMPAFGERVARERLAAAAEMLALDLAEARHEAARSGRPLHLVYSAGADWCYAVARAPGCDCRTDQACQLKVVRARDVPGVDLVEAEDAGFDPAASMPTGGAAQLRGLGGTQAVRVSLSPLGRPRVCTSTGLKGYAAC